MVNKKNACKLEFADHLWLLFFDQPQSDVVDFALIYFHICIILVTKRKHVIVPNDIITFNEVLENSSEICRTDKH